MTTGLIIPNLVQIIVLACLNIKDRDIMHILLNNISMDFFIGQPIND